MNRAIIFAVAACVASFNEARATTFSISVAGDAFPIISGTTDLPDGTQVLVMIKKPWMPDGQQRIARGIPACDGDCFPADGPGHLMGQIVTVRQGRFSAGPFSFNDAPFRSGSYPIEISLSPDPATSTVEQLKQQLGTILYSSNIQIGPLVGSSQKPTISSSCETVGDKQQRVACFARAGIPVVDCSSPASREDAEFCAQIGRPNAPKIAQTVPTGHAQNYKPNWKRVRG